MLRKLFEFKSHLTPTFPEVQNAKEKQCFQSTKVSTGFKSANSLFHRAELWPLRAYPPALVLTCTPTLIRGMRRHIWLEARSHEGLGMPRCCCKPGVMFSVQYWAWRLTGLQGKKDENFNLQIHSDDSETDKMLLCSCFAWHCILVAGCH